MFNEIVQLISNVGFPIVACIFMGMYVKDTTKQLSDVVSGLKNSIDNLLEEIKRSEEE